MPKWCRPWRSSSRRWRGPTPLSGSVILAKDGKILYSGRIRRCQQGLRRAEHNRHEVQPRLDEQDVHVRRHRAAWWSKGSFPTTTHSRSSFRTSRVRRRAEDPIRHLLTHTSGTRQLLQRRVLQVVTCALPQRSTSMMQLAKGDSLAFEPGTRWSYSNTGMLVLGKVIEVVTNRTTSTTSGNTSRSRRA